MTRDANLRTSMLDRIVLAGGATRMPMIRRLVTTMFGRFPSIELNPDEVVALGAAVQAGLKAKDAALDEVVMTDVAPYSMGVEVAHRLADNRQSAGHFDPIIERNTTVPVSRVKNYVPTAPGQRFIRLKVFQGEARMVRDNVELGELQIELPPHVDVQEAAVDVRFTYDVNGLLQVEAKVLKTGKTFALVIEGASGQLTEAEIGERLRRLQALKLHPRDALENRTTMARAERVYASLRGAAREWLASEILRFETALETQDVRVADRARKQLEDHLTQLERSTAVFDEDA